MRYICMLTFFTMIPFMAANAQVSSSLDIENEVPEADDTSEAILTDEAKLYNFSSELLKAAENCTEYTEDFTAYNPDLTAKTDDAEITQQITVKINGWQNEQCSFYIEYVYSKGAEILPKAERLNCNIVQDDLNELVSAMQDRSAEVYNETFYIPQYDENGEQTDSVEQSVSGSHFDVSFAQVKALLCESEEFEPVIKAPEKEEDPEEQLTPEEYAARYNLFSPEFMISLQNCTANKEDKLIDRISHSIEVIGKENKYCHVKYDLFDLNLPLEVIPSIHGFDDIKTLLKNKEIAKYNHKPEYVFDGLVHAYNACHNKHSYYGVKEVKRENDILITRGMNAVYDGKACVINLTNDVEIEGEKTDYSTMCRLTNKTMDELWPIFEDVLTKYGEEGAFGPNGRFRISRAAIENKETHDADLALMMYMQQEEYCMRPNLGK
ncbi:MAG: hypothetical protein J6N49_05315 [Alphaproteobacteria bacterium]|nr:hypothetical protein [Alphaproteobacteria bacterium]